MPGGATNWWDPSGAKVMATVRANAVGLVPADITFPTLSWQPNNNGRGSLFTIVVETTFQPLIPLVPLPTITIQGASSLVIQH
jgi:hypothetical protein